MTDFIEKKFDVLVSTNIIENGLDISNANTILINRADRFGLAELHQPVPHPRLGHGGGEPDDLRIALHHHLLRAGSAAGTAR